MTLDDAKKHLTLCRKNLAHAEKERRAAVETGRADDARTWQAQVEALTGRIDLFANGIKEAEAKAKREAQDAQASR